MPKMIQIRGVPDRLHSILKARAARDERIAERPTMREWLDNTREANPVRKKRSGAKIIRALRDSR